MVRTRKVCAPIFYFMASVMAPMLMLKRSLL